MTAPRVVVAGDANLDLVLRGDVVPRFGQAEQVLDAADVVLGSSAGICASGLARLGVATTLCARVGDDAFGIETVRMLQGHGVDASEVEIVDAPTGVSVILSTPGDRAILTLGGAMTTLAASDILGAVQRTGATHLHVASFFLLPALAAHLAAVLSAVVAAGVTTSLDTNWDPADRWAGVEECLPHLNVLLPNAAEAVALAGAIGVATADPEDAARALAARGPLVVVKDGAAGGFAVRGTADAGPHAGPLVVRAGLPIAVDVVDTTGAGDSFDAGFLRAWLAGSDLIECVRQAAAVGALSTRSPGGTGAQPTLRDLQAALA